MQALSTIKALGLKPKRTMRLVMWTAEEPGVKGGDQYYQTNKVRMKVQIIVNTIIQNRFDMHGI